MWWTFLEKANSHILKIFLRKINETLWQGLKDIINLNPQPKI